MAKTKVTLIGGGLAGSLLSIYLARRGHEVEVFERRPDMRTEGTGGGRSINLAISARGIHALERVGLFGPIEKLMIRMKGRMIHSLDGRLSFQRYGKDDSETNNSIHRAELNTTLLDLAGKEEGVEFHFNRECVGADLERGELEIKDTKTGAVTRKHVDVAIGTDGSASALRAAMVRSGTCTFTEEDLGHGYKELTMPPAPDRRHPMERDALHIWPRGTYMLIALPNLDGSFTCTLFLPWKGRQGFEDLTTRDQVERFFGEQFSDAVPYLPNLEDQFLRNPTGRLATIRSKPWHARGRFLLLGDSAHAIVPFFGQGMNCAFEDITVLSDCLDECGENWEQVFAEYENRRKINTDAIADMALENFVEMRDKVGDPNFLLKKKVGLMLEEKFPEEFVPRYSLIMFHRVPYSEAKAVGDGQERILDELCRDLRDPSALDWKEAEKLIRGK